MPTAVGRSHFSALVRWHLLNWELATKAFISAAVTGLII
jgi:hypothetical protein